ncbi:MAG TPA: SDR family oxidoreductase [Nitrososphaerales archaeon]|nr:SDR family oxidoreductase [Nitrososphaerales archaeon]
MQSLHGKIAVITGAGSGIGLATSKLFRQSGAVVIGVDKSFNQVKLPEGGDSADVRCDLKVSSDVGTLFRDLEKKYRLLNVIVNSAGIEMKGNVVEASVENYELVMDTNVKSTFLVCKYGIPLLLRSSNSGAVINLSSDLGLQPIPGVDTYAASKGAIIALTKAMSKNWAKSGLRVNCVAPGPIDTPLLTRFQDPETLDFVKNVMLPQGRFGTPEEVARIIAFLASDEASLINGAIITANGGLVG